MDFIEFEDNGRTYTCRCASSPATPGTNWWWLDVTGESQRYATFRAESTDTPQSLRTRMIAHYEKLLVDRARPREFRTGWARRAPTAKPADGASNPTEQG